MATGWDLLAIADTAAVAAIESVPTLVEAREIIAEFHLTIRLEVVAGLTP